eukprot:jgi/Ulvmu1/10508/UM064_0046.1
MSFEIRSAVHTSMKQAERRASSRSPNANYGKKSGLASPCQAELDACARGHKSLADQLSTMRMFYERASDKAHSLRQSLKTCRKCLSERDTQLDVANRIIEKLANERAALEGKACDDKVRIQRLKGSIMHAKPQIQLSQKHQQDAAQLSERAHTAEATSQAAAAVIDKYEREAVMLRAALDMHVQDFQDGSNVHSSLIIAVAQVREENGQLKLQLAQAQRFGRDLEQAHERLQTKLEWFQEQKRLSDAEALRCQTCCVDMSTKLELLTAKHEKSICELHHQKQTNQELSAAAGDVDSDMDSLRAQVQNLKTALATADKTTEAQCHSIELQWQERLDGRVAELLAVQNSLQSQLDSMRAHSQQTSAKLEQAVQEVNRGKQAHRSETEKWLAQLSAERKVAADAAGRAASHQLVVQGQDSEIRMLHDQVNDLTGVNHQLQLELEEARASADAVKDDLFNSVQKLVSKDHELQEVMKEADNTTEVLRKEYSHSCEQNRCLAAEMAQIKSQMHHGSTPVQPQPLHRQTSKGGKSESQRSMISGSTAASAHVGLAWTNHYAGDPQIPSTFERPAPATQTAPNARNKSEGIHARLMLQTTVAPAEASDPRQRPSPQEFRTAITTPIAFESMPQRGHVVLASPWSQQGNGQSAESALAPGTFSCAFDHSSAKSAAYRPAAGSGMPSPVPGSVAFGHQSRSDAQTLGSGKHAKGLEVIWPDGNCASAGHVVGVSTSSADARPLTPVEVALHARPLGQNLRSSRLLGRDSVQDSQAPKADLVSDTDDCNGVESIFQQPWSTSVSSRHDPCMQSHPAPVGPQHQRANSQPELGGLVPGEVARWEERLKDSQERLHIMRMERAQWHAMVHASEKKKHGKCISTVDGSLVTSAGPPASVVRADGLTHAPLMHVKSVPVARHCGERDGVLPGNDRPGQSSSSRHACQNQESPGTSVTGCVQPYRSSPGQPHHRHRQLHEAQTSSSCSGLMSRGNRHQSGTTPPIWAHGACELAAVENHSVDPGTRACLTSGSYEPDVEASSQSRPTPLSTRTSAQSREACAQSDTIRQTSIDPLSMDCKKTDCDAAQTASQAVNACNNLAGRRGGGECAADGVSLTMETPRTPHGAQRGQRGVSNRQSEQCRSQAGITQLGGGDVRWAECIRHSVAGALDQAMEALEAELGYRSCEAKETSGKPHAHVSGSVGTRLSDLASMEIGADSGLFDTTN